MAAGIQKSGLSEWMAGQLAGVRGLPPFGQVLLAALLAAGWCWVIVRWVL